jgi:hypothetical protein
MDLSMELRKVNGMANLRQHLAHLRHLDVLQNLGAHLRHLRHLHHLHLADVLQNLGELNLDGCLPLVDAHLGEADVVQVDEESRHRSGR